MYDHLEDKISTITKIPVWTVEYENNWKALPHGIAQFIEEIAFFGNRNEPFTMEPMRIWLEYRDVISSYEWVYLEIWRSHFKDPDSCRVAISRFLKQTFISDPLNSLPNTEIAKYYVNLFDKKEIRLSLWGSKVSR